MIAVNTTADHHEYALTVYDIDKKISVNYQCIYLQWANKIENYLLVCNKPKLITETFL